MIEAALGERSLGELFTGFFTGYQRFSIISYVSSSLPLAMFGVQTRMQMLRRPNSHSFPWAVMELRLPCREAIMKQPSEPSAMQESMKFVVPNHGRTTYVFHGEPLVIGAARESVKIHVKTPNYTVKSTEPLLLHLHCLW